MAVPARHVLLTAGHPFQNRAIGAAVYFDRNPIGHLTVAGFGPWSVGNPGTTHGNWAVVNLNDRGVRMITNQLRNGQRIQGLFNSPVNSVVSGIGSGGAGLSINQWFGTVRYVNRTVPFIISPIVTFNVSGLTTVYTPIDAAGVPVRGDSGVPIWRTVGNTNFLTGTLVGGDSVQRHWHFSPVGHSARHFAL